MLSSDTDLGFGFSLVRFEAEYPVRGFGIVRLTPKYEQLPMPWYPESSGEEERTMLDSNRELFPGLLHERVVSSVSEEVEETFPDEIWDKLPSWVRALHKIKRKARQGTS
jgi:hypothetical protein